MLGLPLETQGMLWPHLHLPMSSPQSSQAQALAERLEHAISQPDAEYGALLVKGVRMADFLAASEQLEVRGLYFTTCSTWEEAEQELSQPAAMDAKAADTAAVVGNVFRSSERSMAHGAATAHFTRCLERQLRRYDYYEQLEQLLSPTGSGTRKLANGKELEPDASFDFQREWCKWCDAYGMAYSSCDGSTSADGALGPTCHTAFQLS